jgi:NAD+ diphosphatase
MTFLPAFSSEEPSPTDLFFVFEDDKLMIKAFRSTIEIPCRAEIQQLKLTLKSINHLGILNGISCYAAEIDQASEAEGESFQALRSLLGQLDEELFSIAGRAFQIIHWERTHIFCCRCGNRTGAKTTERAKECPQCGLIIYPHISPAIIVAVTKGREILLANSRRFHSQLFSVLAGFVEPGETLEETVKREVKEETGIEVRNIRYFGSQPWPFPNSLMVAFTAEYAEGEIRIDETEISEAQWFKPDKLPPVPRTGTIARELIDWFLEAEA